MEHPTNKRVQYLVTFAVSLASMTAGVVIFWCTPIIPKFHDGEATVNLTEKEISWMIASSSPGFMTGSLITRYIADRFGRRTSILGSALPFTLGTIMLYCAVNAWMLYLTRFLWGIGAGIMVTVATIYLVEIADKDIRGALSVANRTMFSFGSLLVMAVAPFVQFKTVTYMLLVLPVMSFAVCWWIPETPYYYLKERNVVNAKKVLSQLRGYKEEKILEEVLTKMKDDVNKEMQRPAGSVKELFTGKQYRRALIISVGLKFTQITAGSNVIQQYLGRIMQESESGLQVSTALIIFGAVRFLVGVLSSVVVDKLGRRPMLICSYLVSSVALSVVAIYFYFQEVIGIHDEANNPYRFIAFIGIIVSIFISTMGFDSLVHVVPAEIFPINVKSLAMTLLNILGGFTNFFVARSYQEIKDWTGLRGVFFFFSSATFCGAIFSYFIVPETKGKGLREIQQELQGEYYDDVTVTARKEDGENVTEMTELKVSYNKEKNETV